MGAWYFGPTVHPDSSDNNAAALASKYSRQARFFLNLDLDITLCVMTSPTLTKASLHALSGFRDASRIRLAWLACEAQAQSIHEKVDDRSGIKRQQLADNQSPDNGYAERLA